MPAARRYDYLILGAGVAGATAAETLRQEDRLASIGLVGDEPYLMYYRPRLPGYIAGHISRATILERDISWAERRRIDAYRSMAAAALDPADRRVTLSDGQTVRYGRLLLATGARPRRLGVPGDQLPGVSSLWQLADAERILGALPGASHAVIVGGGFIGAELTEALRLRGLDVTYLCRGPWWRAPLLDEAAGRMVTEELALNGVDVRYNTAVARVLERDGRAAGVLTSDGERFDGDVVTTSLGPTWDLAYLAGTGLASERGVATDEWLRTGGDGIWAAGALANTWNPRANRRVNLHNVFTAGLQGHMAALGMLGRPQQLLRAPQYGIRLFGLALTFVGVVDASDPTLESTVTARSPRSYARIFSREGRIVGALLINSPAGGPLRRMVEEGALVKDSSRLLARLTP